MFTRRLILASPALIPSFSKGLDFDALPLKLLISNQYDSLNSILETINGLNLFKNAGLNITIESASSQDIYESLEKNTAHLGVVDMNAFIKQISEDESKTLKAFFNLVDRPPLAVVGRKSRGITQELISLYDKTLGVPQNELTLLYWSSLLKKNNINEEKIKLLIIGNSLREPMLASGEIDAVLGSQANLIAGLKARSVPEDDIISLPFYSLGSALYGSSVIASTKLISEQKEALVRFNMALKGGLAVVFENTTQERLKLFFNDNINTPFARENGLGRFDLLRYEAVLDQLELKTRPRYEEIITSELL